MRRDLAAFSAFESGATIPSLRIYSWLPNCISLGYSQEIDSELDQGKAARLGWDVVTRPTGGGIVFHNEAEVTYSLVMAKDDPKLPQGLVPSYKKISEAIIHAMQLLGVNASLTRVGRALSPTGLRGRSTREALCFSFPAEYEVVVDNKKIVGSAQKRGKRTLLQQGSIFVRPTPASAFELLKKHHTPLNAISVEELLGRTPSFDELSAGLINGFREVFGVDFMEIR